MDPSLRHLGSVPQGRMIQLLRRFGALKRSGVQASAGPLSYCKPHFQTNPE